VPVATQGMGSSVGGDVSADATWLKALAWEKSAPPALVSAARSGDLPAFRRAWTTWWKQTHRTPRPTAALCASWSCPTDHPDPVVRQCAAIGKPASRRTAGRPAMKPSGLGTARWHALVHQLLDSSASPWSDPALLIGLELLLRTTLALPHKLWWPLWKAVWSQCSERMSDRSESSDSELVAPDEPLMRDGELPVLAGLAFAPLQGCAAWAKAGGKRLSQELVSRTDTDGTPHAELLPRLPLWLASFVRTWTLCDQLDLPSPLERVHELLGLVSEKAVALCRADGKLALTNGLAIDPLPPLHAVARLLDWPKEHPSAQCLKSLEQHTLGRPVSQRRSAIQVMPSNQSDWARLAVLRSDWSHQADSVAITHHGPLPAIDVTFAGQPLLHGTWDLQLEVGGATVELAEEWACVCWESDPDSDYVELQMCGPGKLRVERLLLLSRRDRCLLVADCISGAPQGGIRYRAGLPLVDGVQVVPDTSTRELRLQTPKLKARLFPLGLPMERVQSTAASCRVDAGQVVFTQDTAARGLVMPVFFDWHPQRRTRPAVWRTLTISENMQRAAADAAAGYRMQLGADQWLFYRSLRRSEHARAVLGHHTFHETVIGRFDADGTVDPLLMIER
jgi:hypothetical protein